MLKINNRKRAIIKIIDFFVRPFFGHRTKAKNLDLNEIKKILVLELWGIGDVVLSTAVLIALRQRFPKAEIVLLAKEHAREVLENDYIVDRIVTYDFPWTKHRGKYRLWKWDFKGIYELIKGLREECVDLTIDARGDFRNNLISYFIASKRRVGYDFTGGAYFLTDVVSAKKRNEHRVDEWKCLIEYLDINTEDFRPRLDVSSYGEKWLEDFKTSNDLLKDDLIVGIHVGAAIKKRCWPLDRFIKIAYYIVEKYKAKIIFFVEPNDFVENIPIDNNFKTVKLSLQQLISLISELDLFICNDSGPMHIATAVDTPVIAIFGPGDIQAMGPYGEGHRIVCKENVMCRPCYDYCKYKEPHCLKEIKVEDVIKVVDEKLNSILVH